MPYMKTLFSGAITPAQEETLKKDLGEANTLLPGKTEDWLMLSFEDNCRLWFKGDQSAPTALVEVAVFGHGASKDYEALTARITEVMEKTLSVPPSRTYVKYEETTLWGWNGTNF